MKHWISDLREALWHKEHRTALFASFSTIRSVLYSLGMFVLGIMSTSIFLIINGTYQLLLSFIRVLNVFSYSRTKRGTIHHIRTTQITGLLLIFLGIVYAFLNVYFFTVRPVEDVSKFSMLLTATVSFVKLGSSILGFFTNRKLSDEEVVNIRLLSLIDAIVSIVTTQRVILMFVEGSESAATSTPLFGMGIGAIFVVIGAYLFFKRQNVAR